MCINLTPRRVYIDQDTDKIPDLTLFEILKAYEYFAEEALKQYEEMGVQDVVTSAEGGWCRLSKVIEFRKILESKRL